MGATTGATTGATRYPASAAPKGANWAIALRRVAAEVIATILPSHGQSPFSKMPNESTRELVFPDLAAEMVGSNDH